MRKYLYTIGIMAFVVMVLLAPQITSPIEFFNRFGFTVIAVFAGYLLHNHRHQLRARYTLRLRKAFNTDRHRDSRIEAMYRRERKLQTV